MKPLSPNYPGWPKLGVTSSKSSKVVFELAVAKHVVPTSSCDAPPIDSPNDSGNLFPGSTGRKISRW